MATIEVRLTEYGDVEMLRDLYRAEAGCQIVRDSMLRRGLADPYLILVDGRVAGYGAVLNKYDTGRISEFYALPDTRPLSLPMLRAMISASGATSMQAQTNMPAMLMLLYDCATRIKQESILFSDAFTTALAPPGALFRPRAPEDPVFEHGVEPIGDYVIEAEGKVVATGGFLCHYNPPYGDIYMEVEGPSRRKGYGGYLVQELKRVCYEAGRRPAARCSVDNAASRNTLQKAGLLPCGRVLAGRIVRKPACDED
jgi:GNAT superfamily N-acetyltransferase